MFEEKNIDCRDCGESFSFTADEQKFFSEKGLQHQPKRCANCRIVARVRRGDGSSSQVSDAQCCSCGLMIKVPFRPRGIKPIYCNVCFMSTRQAELQAV